MTIEDDETEFSNIEADNNAILKDFKQYLAREKGFKKTTVNRHLQNMDFFAYNYLLNYEWKPLAEVDDFDVEDYLGTWYIRKCINPLRRDIKSMLTSFKKFFIYMHHREKIDDEQLEAFRYACKDPMRYYRRLDAFKALDPSSPDLNRQYERWLLGGLDYMDVDDGAIAVQHREPRVSLEVHRALDPARSLNLTRDAREFTDDINKLLAYCISNDGMKLTSIGNFTRKHVHRMNGLLHRPDPLKATANLQDTFFVKMFYIVGKQLGFFKLDGLKLGVDEEQIDQFTALTTMDQFLIIFDAFWNKIAWRDLMAPRPSGRPNWSQKIRFDLAVVLAVAPAHVQNDYYLLLVEIFKQYYGIEEDNLSSRYLMDIFPFISPVVREWVFPILEHMGLLKYDQEESQEKLDRTKDFLIVDEFSKKFFKIVSETPSVEAETGN